jgi:hypothetical protein
MQTLSILAALLVADMVPTAALRDCIAQSLQPQEPTPLAQPQANLPDHPRLGLGLAITIPAVAEGPRHLDPCLAD